MNKFGQNGRIEWRSVKRRQFGILLFELIFKNSDWNSSRMKESFKINLFAIFLIMPEYINPRLDLNAFCTETAYGEILFYESNIKFLKWHVDSDKNRYRTSILHGNDSITENLIAHFASYRIRKLSVPVKFAYFLIHTIPYSVSFQLDFLLWQDTQTIEVSKINCEWLYWPHFDILTNSTLTQQAPTDKRSWWMRPRLSCIISFPMIW